MFLPLPASGGSGSFLVVGDLKDSDRQSTALGEILWITHQTYGG
jgi:hypothetical protein